MGKRRGRRLRTLHCKNSVHQRLSLPQTRCASNEQESVYNRLTWGKRAKVGNIQDRLTQPELSIHESDKTESITDRLSRPVPLPSDQTTVGGVRSRLTFPGSSTSGSVQDRLTRPELSMYEIDETESIVDRLSRPVPLPSGHTTVGGECSRLTIPGSSTSDTTVTSSNGGFLTELGSLTCQESNLGSSFLQLTKVNNLDAKPTALRLCLGDLSRKRLLGSESCENQNTVTDECRISQRKRKRLEYDYALTDLEEANCECEDATYASDPEISWDEMNQFGQRDSSTSRSHSHDRSRGRGRGRGAYNCSERGNWRSGSPGNVNRWANSYELPMTRRGAQSFDGGLNSFARDNYTAPLGNERRGRGYRGRGNRGGRGKYFPNESHGMGSTEDYHDNRERGRGSFRARASGRIHPHRKEREHPIGFKDLEKILSLPADAVPLELLRGHSGYALLLKEDSMKDEKFILLIKILSHATDTKSNKESLYELFNSTCNQRFMDRLCCFAMTVRRKFIDEAKEYFSNLFQFLNTYSNAMTTSAIDLVPNVLDACISCMIHLESVAFVSQDLITKYETLQEMLTEAAQHWKQQSSQSTNRTGQGDEMDRVREPPDDFREISILPTSLDLIKNNRPFLRKNITEGKYSDEFHYLDVQFRLLREDFVKPLRTGISDYKDGAKSRFQNIRIYRGVTVVGTSFTKKKMMHLLKLNLPKHIKNIENSKRLLFGNLLCLSNDNFRTLVFASVADRDAELYKNEGIIGVQFETDIENVDFSKNFVMAESKAYFMAYKHVLKALQEMVDNGVALAPYIIKVQPNVDPPKYMGAGEIYDLRVMKHMKLMKRAEARNRLFDFEDETVELEDDLMPHLRRVFIQRDLISWPSEDDLGLDSSQRRALRSALTRQLAIIQGPPGTGKTFIGLKITQILLHNSSTWKDADRPTPILVVCFTNHALDQFLEGMTLYTNNIVRVGSRTKSEKISRFQVNSLVRSLHGSRGIPAAIHEMGNTLFHEIMDLESSISKLRATLNACRYMKGIVMLSQFSEDNIIPSHLKQQLSKIGLKNWLLLSIYPQAMGKTEKPKQQKESTKVQNRVQDQENLVLCVTNPQGDELDSDEEFQDAEEFIKQQEQERYLGDDDADSVDLDVKTYNVKYELSDEMLAFEMEIASQAYEENKNNFEAAFKYDILAGQREVLGIGLDMPLDVEMAANLEKQPYLDLSRLDFPSRWLLYKFWMKKMGDNIGKALSKLESRYQRKSKAHKEIKDQEYLYLMRHASIVGMTTTGAAQYCSIMQDLGPSIVIIEEAAEILESHVITSLTSKCQHLIMIGDHQQLRPSATVFELATKFGLDTSLFERMIKNGLAYETLEYQHRMRPNISRLLVPSIYPELKDHPSVSKYPRVRGIASDVFFLDHEISERAESDDNNSHENEFEAELIMGLCRHLMLQGYSPDEVTILTPYSGQFFLLKKIQRRLTACLGVRICVVDNYQGEENNIILLSLVRSNEEGKVGFLRTDNRVCVALSRAKHGLYVTGNMDLLSKSSDLWKKVKSDLEKDKSFGRSLRLRCENHPDEIITVSTGEDFHKKAPEGGCLRTCNKNLPKCSHSCPKICHLDDLDHKDYKCRVPCPEKLCDLNHPCPMLCFERCPPCKMRVPKLFSCGHTNTISCHIDPEYSKCPVIIEKEIVSCQHKVMMPCHQDPEKYPCPEACDTRLDCGHQCRMKCHRTKDPDHVQYNCMQTCTKFNAGCTQSHACQRYCYEDCGKCIVKVDKKLPCGHVAKDVECHSSPESVQCKEKCKKTLPCGHACKKLCYNPCNPCPVKIKKVVPECNHTVLGECGKSATLDMCSGSCRKILSCNHPCTKKCNEPCTAECNKLVVTTTKCPRNHPIRMPCHLVSKVLGEDAWKYCDAPCQQQLDCDHQCGGICGGCFQGRLHMPCNKACNRSLVCGHICKHPCSLDCPPCQELCNWMCKHSRCRKKCGILCTPCQEKCRRQCEHQKCDKFCGQSCSVLPCDNPCPKKLKCGHLCVGFCGESCPPLCRHCNAEELTEFILLGYEEDDDARFVYLEDCGHSIEVQGLEGWFAQENVTIGMKTCPRCRKSVYNNERYKNIILNTYNDVSKVKSKYFTSRAKVQKKDIELILQDVDVASRFMTEVQEIMKRVGLDFSLARGRKQKHKQKFCSDAELRLYLFQAQVLKKACEVLKQLPRQHHLGLRGSPLRQNTSIQSTSQMSQKQATKLLSLVGEIVKVVMKISHILAPQMEKEIGCELQRLMILPSYWSFLEKISSSVSNQNLVEIKGKLEKLMVPTVRFKSDTDKQVRQLLKESEKYVGGLGISESEKLAIIKAMGLKQGHWYKCKNGHVYCITECGGAMIESNCPECGSRIGGASHTLRSDNSVATEMDGARFGAWSDQNNIQNYDMDGI